MRLTAKSQQASKPRDSGLNFSNRSGIWQTPRWHRCRHRYQVSKQYDHYNTQSRGYKTSRDLSVRCFTAWWIEAQVCLAIFIGVYLPEPKNPYAFPFPPKTGVYRGRLTKAYDVTIPRNRKSQRKITVGKMHILRCVGSKFWVKFQRTILKFHTKFWNHTPQNMHFTRC